MSIWSRRAHAALALGVFLAVTLGIYHASLRWPFEGWDDLGWIRDVERRNTLARMFSLRLLTGNEGPDTSFVPMQSVFFYVMVKAFGPRPEPFRCLAVAAHAVNALLVIWAARRVLAPALGRERAWAWSPFVALLFLVNVSHTHVLTWVGASVAHALVLPMLLGMLLLWARFLEGGSRAAYILCVLLYAVAGMSKETSLTMLVVLPLYHALIHGKTARRAALLYLPFVLLFAGAVVVQVLKYEHGYVANRFGGVSLGIRLVLRLLDFASLHFWPQIPSLWLRHVLMGAVFAGIAWMVWNARRYPVAAFLVFWTVLWLLPFSFSNFRPILELNRYLYLSSVPFAMLVALLLPRFGFWVGAPAATALLAVHLFAAVHRVGG